MLTTITTLEALLTLVPLAEGVAAQVATLISQLKDGANGTPPSPEDIAKARADTEALMAQIRADVA